jgi:hypothetical protein
MVGGTTQSSGSRADCLRDFDQNPPITLIEDREFQIVEVLVGDNAAFSNSPRPRPIVINA